MGLPYRYCRKNKGPHPMEGDNVIISKGRRLCKACKQERERRRYHEDPDYRAARKRSGEKYREDMVNKTHIINRARMWREENKNNPRYRLNKIWHNMRYRCYNPEHKSFEDYGARGITICDEWMESFDFFYDWAIRNGWEPGLQVDRIDNHKGYSPENCRIVSPRDNQHNTRKQERRDLPVGVHPANKRFMSEIFFEGKNRYLGTFDTPEEASEAYQLALEELDANPDPPEEPVDEARWL